MRDHPARNSSIESALASRRTLGLGLAALGAIAFSGKAIVAKLMYRYGVDAFTVVGMRMVLALPFFLAMAWWGARTPPSRRLSARDAWQIAGLGFCGYYLSSTLDFLGLQYISASLERAILYLNPTVVLLLGVVFAGERPRASQVGAVLVAYLGVMVVWLHDWNAVATPSAAAATSGLDPARAVTAGSLLVLGSAVAYAVYLRASARLVDRFGSVRLVGLASCVACGLALLQWAAVASAGHSVLSWLPSTPSTTHAAIDAVAPWGIPWQVWALSLFNAVACTVLPVWFVMRGVQLLGAPVASQVGMVGPLSTIWLASWFLGEPITSHLIVGTGAILAGIIWLARANRPKLPQRSSGSKASA